MKEVIIKIKSTQGLDGEKETIEFSSVGEMREENGKTVLFYCDNATMEGASIKTSLTVSGEKSIMLERTGDINSKLLIEKGVRNNCFYSVPQGNITLGIYGKEIKNRLTTSGGSIKMIYTIDADMNPISENTVEIKVSGR